MNARMHLGPAVPSARADASRTCRALRTEKASLMIIAGILSWRGKKVVIFLFVSMFVVFVFVVVVVVVVVVLVVIVVAVFAVVCCSQAGVQEKILQE
jgi:hypothetical protein